MERLKHAKKVVGLNQTLKCIDADTALVVFVAADADHKIEDAVDHIREKSDVEIIEVESMKTLGRACGIDVNAAIACLIK